MTIYINSNTNVITIGTQKIITTPQKSMTIGDCEEDFSILEKLALKNNLSEKEAINLIDSVRNELPMNQ
ncbi:MAG: hypothetical protein Q7R95_03770 [bacterium]|nr:hypothetical protein [bacterium]